MKAQVLQTITDLQHNPEPLVFCEREIPSPGPYEVLLRVRVWRPVLAAMEHLRPGGRLVINAIRKEDTDRDLPAELDYPRHLWLEKEIKSVANVCRSDVRDFLKLAAELDIRPRVEVYPLEEANRALTDLKSGAVCGAKVLTID
ncbi:MAG: hypothetical protein U9P36_13135 [Thermodesulfobacteriota bacterium]|nr:hypothetical protein [Thermodesulfobacteriota bacterium]